MRKVSDIRIKNSEIERWGFIYSGNLVVVKSNNENGQAIYELVDIATGQLRD